VIAFRIEGKNRYSQTKINRSMFRSRTREGDLRLRTITCRRSTRFSASMLARDSSRVRASRRSLSRNANIAPSSRSGVNMTVMAGLVAQLADIDLKSAWGLAHQRREPLRIESGLKTTFPLQRDVRYANHL
jgi:hypothetical protein